MNHVTRYMRAATDPSKPDFGSAPTNATDDQIAAKSETAKFASQLIRLLQGADDATLAGASDAMQKLISALDTSATPTDDAPAQLRALPGQRPRVSLLHHVFGAMQGGPDALERARAAGFPGFGSVREMRAGGRVESPESPAMRAQLAQVDRLMGVQRTPVHAVTTDSAGRVSVSNLVPMTGDELEHAFGRIGR